MSDFTQKLEQVKKAPRFKGRRELLLHLKGNRMTPTERIRAKCNECCNGFIDGPQDCQIETCPLYPLRPYPNR
jgi:hypothetical protein